MAKGRPLSLAILLFSHSFCSFFPAEGIPELAVVASVLSTPDLVDQVGKYFHGQTRALVECYSYPIIGGRERAVDMMRDVFRNVVAHWVATELVGPFRCVLNSSATNRLLSWLSARNKNYVWTIHPWRPLPSPV